ncbi:unnamed protein product, partial [Vitis vinifera]
MTPLLVEILDNYLLGPQRNRIKSSTVASCHACSILVHLGGVLSKEDTTIIGSPTFISVNDDLAANETNITMRNNRLDDTFFEINSNFVIGDSVVVLGRNEDNEHEGSCTPEKNSFIGPPIF